MTGPTSDPTAGLRVRQSVPADAPAPIDAGGSLVQLHQSVVDVAGVVDAIVASVRELPGDRHAHQSVLTDSGVTALNGRLADALATLAAATDPDADAVPAHAHRAVLDLLERLGTGHVHGHASDRSDVFASLPPLLAASTSPASTPTVSVRLGIEFAGAAPGDREAVLRWLADLATGADVVLVVGDAAAHRIVDAHADVVPTWVLTKCADRRRQQPAPVAEQEARQTAADARDALNPGGRPTGVLRHLSRASTHSLTYDQLASRMALDSPPYETVRRLDDVHGLVERTERADGATVASLRPAGQDYLSSLASDVAADGGLSPSSSAAGGEASGASTGVSHAPQNRPDMPCFPSAWDPTPRTAEADETGERPPEEAADAADGDRRDRYRSGLVTPEPADAMDWIPATEAVDAGEVALCDVDLSARLDDDRDGRAPLFAFDSAENRAYVAGEYSNPMQFATTIAHGLTCQRMLGRADVADRIGEDLAGLDVSEMAVLWSASCVGWLPGEVETGADVVDHWRDARDALLELSGKAADPDSDVTRSLVTRRALGLIGTVVTVLDLAGVDVVLEARVPECSRHFGESNQSRRRDLLDHLGTLSALTSRVGAFSAFRQLFESRADRRSDAFTPTLGSDKQPCTGSMRAGIVVTGDGVEDLADDVLDAVGSPRSVHSDAPPIAVDVDVRTGVDRDRYRSTARRLLSTRNLRPTPAAVMVLRAFGATTWGAAEGLLLALEKEPDRRDVDLVEVRKALGLLDADRLLPDCTGSARAGVAALLDADRPLSQAELARRAGISAQSWRTHRDGLVAADIVRETDDGWRLALPFASERWDRPDVADPPWYLLADADDAPAMSGDPSTRRVPDVLWWLVERGVLDADRLRDPGDPVGHACETVGDGLAALPRAAEDRGAAVDALDAAGVPPGIVLAGVRLPAGEPPTARMGRSTRQTTLS